MFIRNLVFSLNGLSFVLCATLIFSLMQQFIATLTYPPLEKNKKQKPYTLVEASRLPLVMS